MSPPPWASRGRGPSSARSRSSTLVSDAVATSIAGEDDDDNHMASAPSSPSGRLFHTIRRSESSRSFDSLDILAAGGDSGPPSGDVVGERQPEKHDFFGSRRRVMSTADALVDPTLTSSKWVGRGPGFGGRERAWTSGSAIGDRGRSWTVEEGTVWTRKGGIGLQGSAASRGGKGNGGASGVDDQPESLQRISAVWDTEKDGPLSQMPVPFDRVGRKWSRKFNVDAANTAGPLETSGATLGVSVSALTGQFHRTRVVTLYPRLIVRNFLGIPLEVRAVRGGHRTLRCAFVTTPLPWYSFLFPSCKCYRVLVERLCRGLL